MTYKEAREYLHPVAYRTPWYGYGAALRKAIEALEIAEMEEISKKGPAEILRELQDELTEMLDGKDIGSVEVAVLLGRIGAIDEAIEAMERRADNG